MFGPYSGGGWPDETPGKYDKPKRIRKSQPVIARIIVKNLSTDAVELRKELRQGEHFALDIWRFHRFYVNTYEEGLCSALLRCLPSGGEPAKSKAEFFKVDTLTGEDQPLDYVLEDAGAAGGVHVVQRGR